MDSIELNKVLILVNKNKHKLYMESKDIGSYEIDLDQVSQLILNINTNSCLSESDKKLSIDFLNRIIKIIKYVTFDEYICVIHKICDEIKIFLLSNSCKYHKIFFGGYGTIKKSYTWVLFLYLDKLSSFFYENPEIMNKIYVCTDSVFVGQHAIIQDSVNKYLYLFFDDMSYSGSQMYSSIPKKRVDVDIYISAPYMSKTAINLLKQKNDSLNYWHNIQIIPSIRESFLDGIDNTLIEYYDRLFVIMCMQKATKFYKSFQCYESIIPIYFDHKIADGVSTFQKLIYFGIYPIEQTNPECHPICKRTPLIKKCLKHNNEIDSEYNNEKVPQYNYCHFGMVDMEDEYACPMTFYKEIIYNLSDDDVIPKYDKLNIVTLTKYYVDTGRILTGESFREKYLKYKTKYLKLKKILS